jgi:type IX secretion system substrate protein
MKKVFILLFAILLCASSDLMSQEKFRSGIFLHHSTGNCIWGNGQGTTSVPDEITAYNVLHNYTGEDACSLGETGWPLDPWNNEWYRWHSIFDGTDATANISSYLQNNKIVMIKSCYPSSSLTGVGSEADLSSPTIKSLWNYKHHWMSFIEKMADYPDNFFVIWTNAPLVAAATNDNAANLSHQFSYWAKNILAEGLDPDFGAFPANVLVFDYFHLTAGTDYKLKPSYAASSSDSHPNGTATDAVAPVMVAEIFDAAIAYEQSLLTVDPPVLQTPANHTTGIENSTDLTWDEVSNATSYTLNISKAANFSTLLVDQTQGTTTYSDFEVEAGQKYYWRVKASNASHSSDWSSTYDFTAKEAELPGSVILTSPKYNATDVSLTPKFVWDPATGADSYLIQIATAEDFSEITFVSGASTNEITLSEADKLGYFQEYYWRVRGINAGGDGIWSSLSKFTTEKPIPGRATHLSPQDGATDIEAGSKLEWSAVEYADSYVINISETKNFAEILIEFEANGLTFEVSATLDAGKTYYWRIAAKNAKGQGSWSEATSFTMKEDPLGVPQLTYPENLAKDVEIPIELLWSAVKDAKEYEVAYGTDLMKLGEVTAKVIMNKYQPSFQNFTTYYWKVRAKNTEKTGAWSEVFEFTTEKRIPEAPTELFPLNGANDVEIDVEFSWHLADLCDKYIFTIWRKGESEPYHTEEFEYDCTIGSRSISKDLEYNTEYEWNVVAVYLDVVGTKSATYSFTTKPFTDIITPVEYKFKIAPNPVTEKTVIQLKDLPYNDYQINVYDINGNIMGSTNSGINRNNYKINLQEIVDVKQLSKGMYMLTIEDGSDYYLIKFMK